MIRGRHADKDRTNCKRSEFRFTRLLRFWLGASSSGLCGVGSGSRSGRLLGWQYTLRLDHSTSRRLTSASWLQNRLFSAFALHRRHPGGNSYVQLRVFRTAIGVAADRPRWGFVLFPSGGGFIRRVALWRLRRCDGLL
jgi:hypothetical protein